MRTSLLFLVVLGVVICPLALAQDQETPAVSGIVSRTVSSSDFDVNGLRVRLDPETEESFVVSGPARAVPSTPGRRRGSASRSLSTASSTGRPTAWMHIASCLRRLPSVQSRAGPSSTPSCRCRRGLRQATRWSAPMASPSSSSTVRSDPSSRLWQRRSRSASTCGCASRDTSAAIASWSRRPSA